MKRNMMIMCSVMVISAVFIMLLFKKNEDKFFIENISTRYIEKITPGQAFLFSINSKIIGHETQYHCGIIEQSKDDSKELMPDLDDTYSDAYSIIWSYELEIKSIKVSGSQATAHGSSHKGSNKLFYAVVPRDSLEHVRSIYAVDFE